MTLVHPDCLAAARAGGGWAFERIYEALAPSVETYLAGQGAADPQGSTQEVFLRAFRSLAQFDGDEGALRGWIFRIARNLLIDERRFLARNPRPTELVADALAVIGGDAEDQAVAAGQRAEVAAVLGLLTPEQREVVVLRFIVDLSIEEVAEVTGRAVSAVKALQHRGLASLRRSLSENVATPVSLADVPAFVEA